MSDLPVVRHLRSVPPATGGTRPDGFEALFRADYAHMVRLAQAILVNRAEAEEVVQDAFVDIYRRWVQILNPPGYLRIAVVHGARAVLRRRRQRDELYRRQGASGSKCDEYEYVLDLLDTLPERQRVAVILAYFADFTSAEIGDALGCRVGTAKSLVHRGIKHIRSEMTQ